MSKNSVHSEDVTSAISKPEYTSDDVTAVDKTMAPADKKRQLEKNNPGHTYVVSKHMAVFDTVCGLMIF